jgi:hypothetical protein
MNLEPLEREPAWLTAAVDQRVALLAHLLDAEIRKMAKVTVIMLQLTEPPMFATAAQIMAWDHACDNCSKPCPTDQDLLMGNVERTYKDSVKVVITFGACLDCMSRP